MVRRRSQQTTISLFSFQDIITSVCGILIFLTLLLALELIERGEGVGSTPSSQIVADLRSAVVRATQERETLEVHVRATNSVLQSIAVSSPLALSREVREVEDAANQLEHELPKLEQRAREGAHRETQVEARRFDQRTQREEFANLRKEIARLKEQIKQDQLGDRVYLNFGAGQQRDGWLVEVGGDCIAVAPLNRRAKPVVFNREGGGLFGLSHDSSTSDFLSWSKQDRDAGVYFVFVGRPSGIRRLEALQREFFDVGVAFGFDLVSEEQVLLDPLNGAFVP